MTDVLGADLNRGEEAEERGSLRSAFDGRASMGFFALDDTDDGDHDHARFTCGFDGVDGGRAGSANVVDDDDTCTFTAETFNAAAGAVGLFGFAHKKAVDEWEFRMLLCPPGAGRGDVGDDGVGAHGETSDGVRLDVFFFQEIENCFAREATAFGVKRGGPAIDVVVAGSARGELELAELETGASEERKQLLGVSEH